MTARHRISESLYVFLAFIVLLIFLFPYLYMVSSAFKPLLATFAYPPAWVFRPTLQHFKTAIVNNNLLFYVRNSLIVGLGSTLLTLVLALPATLGLARFNFRGKEGLAYTFLVLQMIPAISVVFGFFFIGQRLGLLDTQLLLIIGYALWNIPWAVWIMRGFIEGIPAELEECAMLEGCTRLGAFVRVTMPLAAPGLAATAILLFIGSWNEFTLAFFLTSIRARTLPTTIAYFLTHAGIQWGPMFATATIGTIPVVAFALLVRRYFIAALSMGAVKG